MVLLDYMKARKTLSKYGIKSIESAYVSNADEAVKFSHGKRIVLKVISGKALHKSKAGLVKLDLKHEEEIRSAFDELNAKAKRHKLPPYKIIAQEMAGRGIEIIIGGRTDPQFGKVILLGLGGIYVEVFRDFALRICPITNFDAEEMIRQLRSSDVITYGRKNERLIRNLLISTSKLLLSNEKIKELDLNPVIVHEAGYDVVDIRILE